MDLDLISEVLADEPAYRSQQVWEWAARGASSYGEMTNLPADARVLLEAARAAGDPAAARPVLTWLSATGLEDARLASLLPKEGRR